MQKLVDLGTLYPVIDECISKTDHVHFLQKHSEKLLEGVELECSIKDPKNGSIKASDMCQQWMEKINVNKDDRFSIKIMPHRINEFGTTSAER